MRVAICEDSKLQYEVLKKQVLKWADEREETIDIEGFESGEEFLFKWPEDCDFDLVLLDINMKGMSGVQLAKEIRKQDKDILIIFITAEVEHALEGYNVSALNYLLKPVKEEALFKCLDISSEKIKENSSNAKYLVFSKGREQIKVNINKIIFISAFDHYVDIHYDNEIITIKSKIGDMEKVLEFREEFVRCHRSYIVNINNIVTLTKKSAILKNKIELPVSKSKFEAVSEKFKLI